MALFTAKSKDVLLALTIFVLGMVCGAVVDRWAISERYRPFASRWQARGKTSGDQKDRMLARYQKELDLTEEQQTRLAKILEESRRSMGKIRRSVRDRWDAVARDTRSSIRELLTPEQQEKFDKMSEKFRRRRPARRPGP